MTCKKCGSRLFKVVATMHYVCTSYDCDYREIVGDHIAEAGKKVKL